MTLTYTLVPRMGAGAVTHRLESDRLVLVDTRTDRTESVPLADIVEVNLRQELPGAYTMRLVRERGPTLTVPSRHFRGPGNFEPRDEEYAAFVRALLAARPSDARVTVGSWQLFAIGVFVGLGGVLTGTVVVAGLLTGPFAVRDIVVLVFAVLMLALARAFTMQGGTKRVSRDDLPTWGLPR